MSENFFDPGYLEFLRAGLISKIIVSFFIFFIGFTIGKFLEKLIASALNEIELNEIVKSISGVYIDLISPISKITSYIIYVISLLMALNHLGVADVIIYVLLGSLFLLLISFFLLSLRDFLPNVLAGIYIYRKKYLKMGSKIKIGTTKGEIVKINLTNVHLKNKKQDLFVIPFRAFLNSEVQIIK
ncbi:mechanosensitive ion channel [Candidatus Woesearchaeota archaeon]|nr:mechanosensitive ion channel [Candidatus Woesearchaeota archaeon]